MRVVQAGATNDAAMPFRSGQKVICGAVAAAVIRVANPKAGLTARLLGKQFADIDVCRNHLGEAAIELITAKYPFSAEPLTGGMADIHRFCKSTWDFRPSHWQDGKWR